VLPTGVGAEVGGEATAAADDGAGATMAGGVGRWSHGGTPSGNIRGALPDGAATTFLFLVSLWVRITSSMIIALLTSSRNVPPTLSAMHSYSLVERPIMRRSFFFSSMSTWSGAYCTRWLNNFE
jgi:hypothetical protein